MKNPLIIIAIVILVIVAYDAIRIFFLSQKTATLEQSPFNRKIRNAIFRILVLGDSTAVGIGAERPEDSTAGRLAQLYPGAEVINLAMSGQRISGLEEILAKREDEHFDIVLIQIGANDIIRLTSMEDIESGIESILTRSKKFGGKIIFLHSGNVGDAKFFPWYVRPILSKRSLQVRDIYKRKASVHGVLYVDLIDSQVSEKFKESPDLYYASDLLHLSSEGYALWYEEIANKLQADGNESGREQ
ncbi:MAG: GDSL-type esterase/lipase family protein [Patescibacteria group bacterium]